MISSDGQNTNRPAPPKTSGGFNRMYSTAGGQPAQGQALRGGSGGGFGGFNQGRGGFSSTGFNAGFGGFNQGSGSRAGRRLLAPGAAGPNRPTAPTPAPTQPPRQGMGQYSGQSSIKPPQYIDIEDTEASVNNTLARGQQAADQRYQIKQMDRAGMSRGKGQQTAAQVQSAKEMASAANQAAETRAQDQMTNEKMRADYEKAREQEALAIAGAQFGMNFAGMQAQLAQQRAAADLMFSLMR